MEITSRVQLVELMRQLKLPLVAAEIGVAEGIFSQELLNLGIEKLYLIDIWEQVLTIPGCASFEPSWHSDNYEGVKNKFDGNSKVIILKGLSTKMAEHIQDNSLGLLYVDADHSFEGVTADIIAYWPKLVVNGVMAFHDAKNEGYGVDRAIKEFTHGIGMHDLVEDGNVNNMGVWIQKQ